MTGTRIAKVQLGTGGPVVGVQGLGCMGISQSFGPTDVDEARATLEHALELGVTLFDTADQYGFGENEKFLAPFFQANRDEVTVATKFGLGSSPKDPSKVTVRNDRPYVRECVEASLRRLSVEQIDLYYMHRHDVRIPLEDAVGYMAELVSEGKVKHLGLCEVNPEELRVACGVHHIAALQSEWSLFVREPEPAVVQAAADLGVGMVPYSPLGRGFLTGSFTNAQQELGENDVRRREPRFNGDNASANVALLEPIRMVAKGRGCTLGQVALAWVHQRAAVYGLAVVPIPGTRRRSRLQENLGATRIELTADELALLEPIQAEVSGPRFNDVIFRGV